MSASACTRSMPGYHCHKQLMCSADDDAVRDLDWKSVLAHVSSQEEEMSGSCVEAASENPRITHVHSLAIPASRKLHRIHDILTVTVCWLRCTVVCMTCFQRLNFGEVSQNDINAQLSLSIAFLCCSALARSIFVTLADVSTISSR